MRKNGAISIVGILLLLFGAIVCGLNVIGTEHINIIDGIFLICVVAFVVWLNVKAVREEDDTLTLIKILMYIAVAGTLLIDILHITDIGIAINLFTLFISSSEITTMIGNLTKKKRRLTKKDKVESLTENVISNCEIENCKIVNSSIDTYELNNCIIKNKNSQP